MTRNKKAKQKETRPFFRTMCTSKGSQSILLAAFVFLVSVFLLSSPLIHFSESAAALSEISMFQVFRDKLFHADFSSYTFASGMGASVYRLMLTGFGGILTILAGLLPPALYPKLVILLTSLRLGISAGIMCRVCRELLPDKSEKTSSLPSCGIALLYTVAALLITFLLHIPVGDTYCFFPILLLSLTRAFRKEKAPLSLPFLLLSCAYLCSQVLLALILLPVLLLLTFLSRKKEKQKIPEGNLLRIVGQGLLAIGLVSILLIPQILQIPAALKSRRPDAVFLQKLGSDTDARHADITYQSAATAPLLQQNGTLFIADDQAITFNIDAGYDSHFQLLNEWIYSLWPSLPSIPFQDTTSGDLVRVDDTTIQISLTTIFLDPLYAAVTLPERKSPVTVSLNGRVLEVISSNPGTVLIELGTYNAGQTLTLTLHSEKPEDLASAQVQFGHLNTLNWNQYTENSSYGIFNLKQSSSGITAESAVAYNSLLLTNIPYEKGWTLYLNGQKSPIIEYQQAWISTPVTPGAYLIHLEYIAPGSLTGGLLSALSLLLLAIFYFSKSSPRKS